MSKRYSIAEARANLSSIVDQAEAGGRIELTRRGKPVAMVISRSESERLRAADNQFAENYRRFLSEYSLDEVGIEKEFFGATRSVDPGRKVDW